MKTQIRSTLVLILLFAQNLQKVYGDCSYDRNLKQCSCSLLDLTNPLNIFTCMQASSFEFNGGTFDNTVNFNTINLNFIKDSLNIPWTKVSLINMELSENILAGFINAIFPIPVDLLSFENITLVGNPVGFNLRESPPQILSLQFINVSSNPLIQRDSTFDKFGNWMSILKNLTVTASQLRGVPCDIGVRFASLSTLDLSENSLLDNNVSSIFCYGAFPNLQNLKLRRNNFRNYGTLCQALSKYNQLKYLDISLNEFSFISNSSCDWPPSLTHLNLSNSGLEHVVISLPPNCEVLDLSHNRIESLNIFLPNLLELYLSHNRLSTLSSMGHIPSLRILSIDRNPIKMLQISQIQSFKNLSSFRGDGIPYTCSCSFIKEMKELAGKSNLTVQRWPEGYTCDSPESFRGKMVNEVNHSLFECHTQLFTAIICVVILLLCVSIIICFVKICRSNKTRSQCMEAGNSHSI